MEYYSAIKKNEILPFATTWMDLEVIMLSEISQTEKYKYHMIWFHLHVESMEQKEQINQNRLKNTEDNLVTARREGGWRAGRMGWRVKDVQISSW